MNYQTNSSIERKFFALSRYFLMTVAIIALVVAIGGGIVGLFKYLQQVDTTIKPPMVSYTELKLDKQKKNQPKPVVEAQAQQAPSTTKNSEDIPLEYLEIMTRIEKSLKSFAKETGQNEPSDNTRTIIYRKAKALEKYFSISDTLKNLEAESKNLETDAPRIKLLPSADAEIITWAEFLDFFFQKKSSSIAQQFAAIEQDRVRVAQDNALGNIILMAAGVGLAVFVCFTLMLGVLSIEKNAYQIYELLHPKTDAE